MLMETTKGGSPQAWEIIQVPASLSAFSWFPQGQGKGRDVSTCVVAVL